MFLNMKIIQDSINFDKILKVDGERQITIKYLELVKISLEASQNRKISKKNLKFPRTFKLMFTCILKLYAVKYKTQAV
jgi:hypothetical protein